MNKIVNKLIELNKTISTMESCTGGFLTSEITNISGSSEILKFSAVTYSNEYKIKMGVSSKTIDKYSVYSIEVAHEMSKCISAFSNSNYGVGITGKINGVDKNNMFGEDNVVFYSIYDRDSNKYFDGKITVKNKSRRLCKKDIVNIIIKEMYKILEIM
jgi:nicotinamide-nucleotide amidase